MQLTKVFLLNYISRRLKLTVNFSLVHSTSTTNASEIPTKPNEDKLIDFGNSDAAVTIIEQTSTNLNNNFIDSNSSLITHNNLNNNNNLVAATENNDDDRGESANGF